jgi:hypothetical protein
MLLTVNQRGQQIPTSVLGKSRIMVTENQEFVFDVQPVT